MLLLGHFLSKFRQAVLSTEANAKTLNVSVHPTDHPSIILADNNIRNVTSTHPLNLNTFIDELRSTAH